VGVPSEEVQRLVEELLPRRWCVKKGRHRLEKDQRQLQRVGGGWSRLTVDLVLYRRQRGDWGRRASGESGAKGDREWGVARARGVTEWG
jgi:hypothetical protein